MIRTTAIFLDLRKCDHHDVNTTVVITIIIAAAAIPSDGSGASGERGTNIWEKEMREANDTINAALVQLY